MIKGPKSDTIKYLFENFQRTLNVKDENVGRPRTATTESIAQLVQQIIRQRPPVSNCLAATAVLLNPMSTYRLMRQSSHLYPYKIKTRQPLRAVSINARETFVKDAVQTIDGGHEPL